MQVLPTSLPGSPHTLELVPTLWLLKISGCASLHTFAGGASFLFYPARVLFYFPSKRYDLRHG
jgi:hypothetical protein